MSLFRPGLGSNTGHVQESLLDGCVQSPFMGDQDAITASEDYRRFRSSIPQRKVRAACD